MKKEISDNISERKKRKFWGKVDKSGECWEWGGSRNDKGYGRMQINKKVYKAHRLSFFLHYGKDPGKFLVLHKCDNPSCVRPDHLSLGTNSDNMKDMTSKNRQRKGEGIPWSKLKKNDVKDILILHSKGKTHREIAKKYNVSEGNVRKILRGDSWSHVKRPPVEDGPK